MAFKCYGWKYTHRELDLEVDLNIFVALRKSGIFQTKLEGCDEIFNVIKEVTVVHVDIRNKVI